MFWLNVCLLREFSRVLGVLYILSDECSNRAHIISLLLRPILYGVASE